MYFFYLVFPLCVTPNRNVFVFLCFSLSRITPAKQLTAFLALSQWLSISVYFLFLRNLAPCIPAQIRQKVTQNRLKNETLVYVVTIGGKPSLFEWNKWTRRGHSKFSFYPLTKSITVEMLIKFILILFNVPESGNKMVEGLCFYICPRWAVFYFLILLKVKNDMGYHGRNPYIFDTSFCDG